MNRRRAASDRCKRRVSDRFRSSCGEHRRHASPRFWLPVKATARASGVRSPENGHAVLATAAASSTVTARSSRARLLRQRRRRPHPPAAAQPDRRAAAERRPQRAGVRYPLGNTAQPMAVSTYTYDTLPPAEQRAARRGRGRRGPRHTCAGARPPAVPGRVHRAPRAAAAERGPADRLTDRAAPPALRRYP